jgi:HEAT repeat protein
MTSTRTIAKVTAAFAGTAVVALGILLLNTLPAASVTMQAQSDLTQSGLTRLKTATNSQERLQAAKWLSQQEATISSEVVQSLGRSLRTDTDPSVRAAVAATIGELAAKQNANSAGPGDKEPQMLELLSAAYGAESNPAVRARIMQAAGEFKEPAAVALLNRGLVDPDPGVRESAQMAKLSRYKKLLVAISG